MKFSVTSVVVFALALICVRAEAQIHVSGYVKDADNGETLIGASVHNGKSGVTTNDNGFFSIDFPEGAGEAFVAYLGYRSDTVHFSSDTSVIVFLHRNLSIETSKVVSYSNVGLHSPHPGSYELSPEIIRNHPAALGETDVLKSLQKMPGIQSGIEGFSGIYVRGGGPDENLIMLDGIPLYNVNHLFGIFSAFSPDAVKKVNVFTGSFPANYGGRVSSVVDVRSNDGNVNRLNGSVSVGLISDKIHLDGPIGDGRAKFSLSARAMHTLILSPIISLAGYDANYFFYDLNGKLSYGFSDGSVISMSLYNGRDIFNHDDSEETDLKIRYGNLVTAIGYNRICGENIFSRYTLAVNRYDMTMFQSAENRSFDFSSGIGDVSAKADYEWFASNSHYLRFGGEYIHHNFKPEKADIVSFGSQLQSIGSPRIDGDEISLFAADRISIFEKLSVYAGCRATLFCVQGKGYFDFQPRVSLRCTLAEGLDIKLSYSRMTQYVHLLTTGSLSLPSDLWVPITKNIKPEISDSESAGVYYTGLNGWEFSVEGYDKQTRNVIEFVDGKLAFQTGSNWEDNISMGNGRSYGLEFYGRKTCGRTTGSLAYTLQKSTRIFPDGSINNGEVFPYQYDHRHNVSFDINHKFSGRFDVNASWTYISGSWTTVPESRLDIMAPNSDRPGEISHQTVYYISSRNNYRLPASHRLDVSANFHKRNSRGERVWTVGAYNLYNAHNPNYVVIDEGSLKYWTFLPFLPFVSYT